MRLLLVTGFLGAGKTTFMKRLLSLYQGQRLALIVNEFGRVGVDGSLLSNLGAAMYEVTGGSLFCTCRLDQFEKALNLAAQESPDIILVETSGLSDPTAVRTVVSDVPGLEYAGCIVLCDAARLEKVLTTVRVCARQLAVSDLILLNKTDMVPADEVERCASLLRERFPQARVEPTAQGAFDPKWLAQLQSRARVEASQETRDLTLQRACISLRTALPCETLKRFLGLIAEDTYRIKGIVSLAEGTALVDCVGSAIAVTPYAQPGAAGSLVALAGRGMPLRRSLQAARQWYPDAVENITYE